MHSDSLNWPKRRLLSDPYSPLCIVMSVRASAFGANHRRSASPSRPLETSIHHPEAGLAFAAEFKAPLELLPCCSVTVVSMPPRSIYVIAGILWVVG
jgi:hypothetical protein